MTNLFSADIGPAKAALVWAALVALAWAGAARAATEADSYRAALSVEAEAKRLSELGVSFAASGNAAEIYLPYLSGEAGIVNQQWFAELPVNMAGAAGPGMEETLAKAVAATSPDLEMIVKASDMDRYLMWDGLWQPDPQANALTVSTPRHENLERLCLLLCHQGQGLARAGDQAGARRLILASLKVGDHLERSPLIKGYKAGLGIKRMACESFLAALGKNMSSGEAQRWNSYGQALARREKALASLCRSMAEAPPEEIEQVVKAPDLPLAVRYYCLVRQHYCLDSQNSFEQCGQSGPPSQAAQLAQWLASQSPQASNMVKLLSGPGPKMEYPEAVKLLDP